MLTGLSLINEIEGRLGYPKSSTLEGRGSIGARTSKILMLVNRVLKNLSAAESWPMLQGEGTLITEAALDYGEVRLDLTNESDIVTVSAFDVSGDGDVQLTPFLVKHHMWAIQIGDDSPIYRVSEVISPTSIRLNRVWLGDTNTPTGADDDTTYRLLMAMDRYTLPADFERPQGDLEDFLSSYNVKPKGRMDFSKERRDQGGKIRVGDPKWYTIYGVDPTSTYEVIHFDPWPSERTMMQYEYERVHPNIVTDVDLILYPQSQLSIIIEAVLYLANRDYEDDARLQMALQEFLTQYKTVRGQNKLTNDRKQLTPAAMYRARSVRLRGAVRIDYGEAFDRVSMYNLP